MSVALLIDYPRAKDETPGRYIPVSGEKRYWDWWDPIIISEGYKWLPGMGVGLDIGAENLPEVLTELRQLQTAVPRYYALGSEQNQLMTERLATVLDELEAVDLDQLALGEIKLFLG